MDASVCASGSWSPWFGRCPLSAPVLPTVRRASRSVGVFRVYLPATGCRSARGPRERCGVLLPSAAPASPARLSFRLPDGYAFWSGAYPVCCGLLVRCLGRFFVIGLSPRCSPRFSILVFAVRRVFRVRQRRGWFTHGLHFRRVGLGSVCGFDGHSGSPGRWGGTRGHSGSGDGAVPGAGGYWSGFGFSGGLAGGGSGIGSKGRSVALVGGCLSPRHLSLRSGGNLGSSARRSAGLSSSSSPFHGRVILSPACGRDYLTS